MAAYSKFSSALEAFCSRPIEEKALYAKIENKTKMDDSKWTPNQFHGYSRMEGLKEQFMVINTQVFKIYNYEL